MPFDSKDTSWSPKDKSPGRLIQVLPFLLGYVEGYAKEDWKNFQENIWPKVKGRQSKPGIEGQENPLDNAVLWLMGMIEGYQQEGKEKWQVYQRAFVFQDDIFNDINLINQPPTFTSLFEQMQTGDAVTKFQAVIDFIRLAEQNPARLQAYLKTVQYLDQLATNLETVPENAVLNQIKEFGTLANAQAAAKTIRSVLKLSATEKQAYDLETITSRLREHIFPTITTWQDVFDQKKRIEDITRQEWAATYSFIQNAVIIKKQSGDSTVVKFITDFVDNLLGRLGLPKDITAKHLLEFIDTQKQIAPNTGDIESRQFRESHLIDRIKTFSSSQNERIAAGPWKTSFGGGMTIEGVNLDVGTGKARKIPQLMGEIYQLNQKIISATALHDILDLYAQLKQKYEVAVDKINSWNYFYKREDTSIKWYQEFITSFTHLSHELQKTCLDASSRNQFSLPRP